MKREDLNLICFLENTMKYQPIKLQVKGVQVLIDAVFRHI